MRRIEIGIVFSNDIFRIFKGINAIDFSYRDLGMVIPTEEDINVVRNDFEKDVRRMFDEDVTIVSEENMEDALYWSLMDVISCPHRVLG